MTSRHNKGAIMTEFALIAPVMVLFILLLLQYGFIIQAHWTVEVLQPACRISFRPLTVPVSQETLVWPAFMVGKDDWSKCAG